jgi:hypothetical protein
LSTTLSTRSQLILWSFQIKIHNREWILCHLP